MAVKCKHNWIPVNINFTPDYNFEKMEVNYTNPTATSHCVCLKCKKYKSIQLKELKK